MSNARNWLVLVDGGDVSQHAFDLTVKLMAKNAGEVAYVDKITVCHVFDSCKYSYLPVDMRHDRIRAKFEDTLIGTMPHANFSVVVREVGVGQKAKHTIAELASEIQADILVLGIYGRKRLEHEREANAQCGSMVEHLLKRPSAPVVVVRPGALEPATRDAPLTLLCGIDGSATGFHALRAALAFVHAGKNDKIVAVHAYDERDGVHSAEARATLRGECEALLAGNGTYQEVTGEHPTHAFIEFANQGDFHFLVVGARTNPVGNEAPPLGSFSAACVAKTSCNVIVSQVAV